MKILEPLSYGDLEIGPEIQDSAMLIEVLHNNIIIIGCIIGIAACWDEEASLSGFCEYLYVPL